MLRGYSLVKINEYGSDFVVHRLIKLATKQWLENHKTHEYWQIQVPDKMEKVCCASAPDVVLVNRLLPRVDAICARRLQQRDGVLVLWTGAESCYTLGHYKESEKLSRTT